MMQNAPAGHKRVGSKVQLGPAHRIISECQRESLEKDSNGLAFNVARSVRPFNGAGEN